MEKRTPSSHDISGVFVFMLLGVFAVFSTVMVLMGVKAYKGTVDRLAEHNQLRIAPAYVRSMVRADDESQTVSVEELSGVTALTLRNVYDDEAYVTRIYCQDGALREWFTSSDREFDPEAGEEICPCEEMAADVQNGLLSVRLLSGGSWTQVDVALRADR